MSTITRAFALPINLDKIIRKIAKKNGMTYSGLVSKILIEAMENNIDRSYLLKGYRGFNRSVSK